MALPLLAIAGLVSMGSKIYTGFQQKKALRKEGALIAEQGEITYVEALRDANIIRHQGEVFAQKQSLQYIGSGVTLGGSALITLKQTRLYAESEAAAVERRGIAVRDLGYKKQDIMESEGNASVLSGFLGGFTSMLSAVGGEK